MGGSSSSSFHTRPKKMGFPIGDKAPGPFDNDEMWKAVAAGLADIQRRKCADHRAHVEEFRKHQEWINRPWTWKNRVAAVINWVFGNR